MNSSTATLVPTCMRCRKRRIKELPQCANCSGSDSECIYYDDVLAQNIPRRYLYSLQEQIHELQSEIEAIVNEQGVQSNNIGSTTPIQRNSTEEYHVGVTGTAFGNLPCATTYIGPLTSARLLERLLIALAERHLASTADMDETDSPCRQALQSLSELRSHNKGTTAMSHIFIDPKKPDTQIQSSTQRALIEHYLKVVQPEYPLLSLGQEVEFLNEENPVRRWGSDTSASDGLAINSVFAIGATLLARDQEPALTTVALAFTRNVRKASQSVVDLENTQLEAVKHLVTAFSFSALCELTQPASGQAYAVLGRAFSLMEQLRAEYQTSLYPLDDEFKRLEYCLMKMESVVEIHFQRPSRYTAISSLSSFDDAGASRLDYSSIAAYKQIRISRQYLNNNHVPSQRILDDLVPTRHRLAPQGLEKVLDFVTATVYLALHPLFTTCPEIIFLYSSKQQHTICLDKPTTDLLYVVSRSAARVIDHYVQANKDSKIISLWIAAEHILQAGAMWATYLIMVHTQSLGGGLSGIGLSTAMTPLHKCTSLLSSIAQRWGDGTNYTEVWDTFLLLYWDTLTEL